MIEILILVGIALTIILSVFIVWMLKNREETNEGEALTNLIHNLGKSQSDNLRSEAVQIRQEMQSALALTRTEMNASIESLRHALTNSQQQFQSVVVERIDKFGESLTANTDRVSNTLKENRQETVLALSTGMEGIQKSTADATEKQIFSINEIKEKIADSQLKFQISVTERMEKFSDSLTANTDRVAGVLSENRQETVSALKLGMEGIQKSTTDATEKQISSINEIKEKIADSQLKFQTSVAEKIEKFGESLTANTDRVSNTLRENRQETVLALSAGMEGIQKSTTDATEKQIFSINEIKEKIADSQLQFQKGVQDRLDKFSEAISGNADRVVNILAESGKETVATLQAKLEAIKKETADSSEKQIAALNEAKVKITESVASGLKEIQEKNEIKLEQMRLTVDEKLHQTLNTRLTESFDQVTKQLIAVQGGLTEMQSLAQDVGSLKRTLTNVKVRGMVGEAQLHTLLDQFLSAEQYEANVAVKPRSGERVEFAVKLPGVENGEHVWLPIDSKFPNEDYQRLQDAYETGDKSAWEQAGKSFEACLNKHAADISAKYIDVPHTTEFALMFLPFESLYGEAIRRPGLFQQIQSKYHVNIVGPTTLVAFLNSLQVGFKTLAISKQSGEVWKVLGAVKTEFKKFGDVITKVQKNLETASVNLSAVSTRSRQMEKKLGTVSALPSGDALLLLPEEESINSSVDDSDE